MTLEVRGAEGSMKHTKHPGIRPGTNQDTIAAIATPLGIGALAVVRMSGPAALAICDGAFRGGQAPSGARDRTSILGEIVARDGSTIDQALVLVMRGPASPTGEDIVEMTCHGGLLAPRLVLRRLIQEGARAAEPGEFTKRAFLNGKMDLAQAEAVEAIVRASSDRALAAALRQLKGGLSQEIAGIESALFDQLALVEANIDFVDEDDVGAVEASALGSAVGQAVADLEGLLAAHERGRYLREGLDVVITGKPNVGKSSLFNGLVGRDRVIVSDVPGTTRDVVDGLASIDGVVVKIHDTAGVRRASDVIEEEAVRRTRQAVAEADLALVVVDASRPPTQEDHAILEEVGAKPAILVANKMDLLAPGAGMSVGAFRGPVVQVSALKGWGLTDLAASLADAARERLGDLGYDLLVNERHAAHLGSSLEAARRATVALSDGMPLEYIAADLRIALDCLGEITGRKVTSGILDEIFSRFCIGK
jgi:tRNA modification GTPase